MHKKKISLGLQGGGTHLAFTWGVIDYLLEDGRFEFEGASGTSAGGLSCAALAQGLLKNGNQGGREELRAFWDMIAKEGALLGLTPSSIDRYFNSQGIDFSLSMTMIKNMVMRKIFSNQQNPFDLKIFRNILENFFDFKTLSNDKQFKLFITATNVLTSKLKIFSGEEIGVESLMASACIPMFSQTVEIDGELYWDGAYIGNPSLFPLIYNCESPDILVILVVPHKIKKAPDTLRGIRWRMSELFHTNTLIREMRAVEFITDLIDHRQVQQNHLKRINMHLIDDNDFFSELNPSSRLNTDRVFLNMLYDRGRSVAKSWVEANYEYVGSQSTIDIKKIFTE